MAIDKIMKNTTNIIVISISNFFEIIDVQFKMINRFKRMILYINYCLLEISNKYSTIYSYNDYGLREYSIIL